MFIGDLAHFISVWDLDEKRFINRRKENNDDIISIIIKEDYLIIASVDKTIKWWNINTFEVEFSITLSHLIKAIVPIGNFIATTSTDRNIKLWDTYSKKLDKILTGHYHDVLVLNISNDRSLIASGGRDNTIRIWDIQSKKQINLHKQHGSIIREVKFSPDKNYVVSVSDDSIMKIWNLQTDEIKTCKIEKIQKNINDKERSFFNVTNEYIITVTQAFQYEFWDINTGIRINTIKRRLFLYLKYKSKSRLV